jgi:hypothetical protein
MAVHKYLDLSQDHLPAAERDRLAMAIAHDSDLPFVASAHAFGMWINVQDFPLDPMGEAGCALLNKYYPSLMPILMYAHLLGCNWVNLDADADEEPVLPTF